MLLIEEGTKDFFTALSETDFKEDKASLVEAILKREDADNI
jgi:hypothetical protein